MAAVAWAEPGLVRFEQDDVEGRIWWATQFELIPGGSMSRAREALRGVVGIEASEAPPELQGSPDGVQYQILPGSSQVVIMGMEETSYQQLEPYVRLILDLFQEKTGVPCRLSEDRQA